MELVLKMHRYMLETGEPYSVRYVPEPVCWTEAPESFKFLSNQRTRWQRGALECLSRHKKMIFNPRYKRLGMVTLPTFVLVDLLQHFRGMKPTWGSMERKGFTVSPEV